MRGDSNGVLSCLERERLEEELTEARSRGRNLSRLRNLTPFERAALEGREQAAQTRLIDHDAEHGCQRQRGVSLFGPAASGVEILRSSLSDDLRMTNLDAGRLEKG